MTAIWRHHEQGWTRLQPSGFEAEAALHGLVADAPHLLPLSGSPALVVVGREVRLGNGYVDLVAVEPSGRLAVIEVKLASNDEARRAVVAQVLAYAAYLDQIAYDDLEQVVLAQHLRQRGYATLAAAAETGAPGAFDATAFRAAMEDNLARGRCRLVLVLDSVPADLTRLVAYLEGMTTDGLVIDLIAVSQYEVGAERVLVPQRVEPERRPPDVSVARNAASPHTEEGAGMFEASIPTTPAAVQPELRRLLGWARTLEKEGVARLVSVRGKLFPVLRIYVPGDMSLVVLFNDPSGGAKLAGYRTVFERLAPESLADVDAATGPVRVGAGNWIPADDPVLHALSAAYREAARAVPQARLRH